MIILLIIGYHVCLVCTRCLDIDILRCLDIPVKKSHHVLNEVKHAFLLSRGLNRGGTDSLVPVIGKANSAFEIVVKDNGMGEKDYYV